MSGHTPGPWQSFEKSAGGAFFVSKMGNAGWIAEVGPHPIDNRDELEANARLIAAAPDLLLAAQFEVRDLESERDQKLANHEYLKKQAGHDTRDSDAAKAAAHCLQARIDRLSAAIAKATGATQELEALGRSMK